MPSFLLNPGVNQPNDHVVNPPDFPDAANEVHEVLQDNAAANNGEPQENDAGADHVEDVAQQHSTPAAASCAAPVPHEASAPNSPTAPGTGPGPSRHDTEAPGDTAARDQAAIESGDVDPGAAPAQSSAPTTAARPKTRLQSGIRKEKIYTDGTVKYGYFTSTGEPHNLEEALGDSNWKTAMDSEFLALQKNKTWHLVPPQKGKNVIDCK